MAKYCGIIGFDLGETETRPGVYTKNIVEKKYTGDVVSMRRRTDSGQTINGSVLIQNNIRIIADKYCMEHIANIAYCTYYGNKWRISSVDISGPVITIVMGDLYNEHS